MLTSIILEMDLAGFLDSISRAHTMAPLLDPTSYREAMDNLIPLEEMARALHKCRQELVRLRDREAERRCL